MDYVHNNAIFNLSLTVISDTADVSLMTVKLDTADVFGTEVLSS